MRYPEIDIRFHGNGEQQRNELFYLVFSLQSA
jgi:hypothetical protein